MKEAMDRIIEDALEDAAKWGEREAWFVSHRNYEMAGRCYAASDMLQKLARDIEAEYGRC